MEIIIAFFKQLEWRTKKTVTYFWKTKDIQTASEISSISYEELNMTQLPFIIMGCKKIM